MQGQRELGATAGASMDQLEEQQPDVQGVEPQNRMFHHWKDADEASVISAIFIIALPNFIPTYLDCKSAVTRCF